MRLRFEVDGEHRGLVGGDDDQIPWVRVTAQGGRIGTSLGTRKGRRVQEHHQATPATTCSDSAIMFVALELSGTSWLVAIQAPGGERISRHKLPAGAAAELLELVGRQRTMSEHGAGRTVRVMSCYEAGRDGFWRHRRLVAEGIENLIIDPASVAVNRRARRAKTDLCGRPCGVNWQNKKICCCSRTAEAAYYQTLRDSCAASFGGRSSSC